MNIQSPHPAIRSADPGLRNSLVLVAVAGPPEKNQSRSHQKSRQHRNRDLGDEEAPIGEDLNLALARSGEGDDRCEGSVANLCVPTQTITMPYNPLHLSK